MVFFVTKRDQKKQKKTLHYDSQTSFSIANTSHNESTVKAEVSARLAGTARLDRQHDAMECYNDFDDSQEHDFGTVLQKTYTTGPLRT